MGEYKIGYAASNTLMFLNDQSDHFRQCFRPEGSVIKLLQVFTVPNPLVGEVLLHVLVKGGAVGGVVGLGQVSEVF